MKSLKQQLEVIKDLPDSPQKEKVKAIRAKIEEVRKRIQTGQMDPDAGHLKISELNSELQMIQLHSPLQGAQQKQDNTPNWHSGQPTAAITPYCGVWKKVYDTRIQDPNFPKDKDKTVPFFNIELDWEGDKIIEDGDPIKKAKREAARAKRIQNKDEKNYNELAAKVAEGTVKVYKLSAEEIAARFKK